MRLIQVQKNTGCILDAVVFDNGFTVSCWQTEIPEVAVYQNVEQFLSVRTPERGYKIIADINTKEINLDYNKFKRFEIFLFAAAMEVKMNKREKKYGESWKDCSIDFLHQKLNEEIQEYNEANIEDKHKELIDVANLCMMLWNRTLNDKTGKTPLEKDD